MENRTAQVPTLSLDERDRRWARVREEMIERSIDCLVVWADDNAFGMGRANLRYLTQVTGMIGPAVGLFPVRGDPVVFADVVHFHQPYNVYKMYQDWTEDCRPFLGVEPIVEEMAARGLDDATCGLVGFGSMLTPTNIPAEFQSTLLKRFPGAEFVDAGDIFTRLRMIKSDEEVKLLREAGAIAGEMLDALMDAEPGDTEAEVYADMIRAQIAGGAESYIFNLMDSGDPTATGPLHLLHGKGQPLSPSRRTLDDGDLIVTEFHAGVGGYLAAAELSVALGSAPDELRDVHEVALQCIDEGVEQFTPGTRLEDVWEAFRAPVREANMDFIELGFHGHGLGSPEFPTVLYPQEGNRTYPDGMPGSPIAGSGIEDMRLREGMVFGTNIDIHDPNWRDDVGVMFGDMVLVTDSGPELLVGTPREFIV